MSPSRSVALLAVGVDRTGLLPTLRGAASGAAEVARWLDGQRAFGVQPTIRLLTDGDGARVSARAVQDAGLELVESGGHDLLILYFSGHGIVKSGGDEQLLLSDAGRYPQEAVNIAATWNNARSCGAPHAAIISDACRNAVDPFSQLGLVSGVTALPRGPLVGGRKSKVDLFYAAEPSQTAKEYKGDGFFTGILLDALLRCPAGLAERWAEEHPAPVIPAWRLEEYLYREVPLRAAGCTPPFEQAPDIMVTSRQPMFLGFATPTVDPARGMFMRHPDARRGAGGRQDAVLHVVEAMADADPARLRAALDEDAALATHAASYAARMKPPSVSSDLLCAVRGTPPARALIFGKAGMAGLGIGTGRDHQSIVRPRADEPATGSLIVDFEGGTSTVLPLLPGHATILHADAGRVDALAFEPLPDAGEAGQEELLLWRQASASALAAAGKLARMGTGMPDFNAAFLRGSGHIDPTLGVYGAYAYALAGDDLRVQSILRWFAFFNRRFDQGREGSIPFDIAMLAGLPLRAGPHLAPFCPARSMGWSLLGEYEGGQEMHPALAELGRRRLNAEWSSYRSEDLAPVLHVLEQGELQ